MGIRIAHQPALPRLSLCMTMSQNWVPNSPWILLVFLLRIAIIWIELAIVRHTQCVREEAKSFTTTKKMHVIPLKAKIGKKISTERDPNNLGWQKK